MKYDETYNPPAPVAKVKLRNPDALKSVADVSMILDTGSDITLLPRIYCEQIGVKISETESLELQGFNQTISTAFYVQIDFIFLKKLFRGKFLVYDGNEGIVGRDVINEFSIIFDGVNLEWRKQD